MLGGSLGLVYVGLVLSFAIFGLATIITFAHGSLV